MGRFSGPRPSAHSYSFFLPSPNILNKEDAGRKYKMRGCPSNPALELRCLIQGCRYVPLSTFGIQTPYSLLSVSAHQDCLNKLGKAPGVFSECALALSEQRLTVVELHIRHPPARETPNLPLSAKSLSAVRNVSTAGKGGKFPKAVLNSCS